MTVLIVEPEDYSTNALELYSKFGSVFLGSIPIGAEAEVKILVVRLAHRLDKSFLDKYPSLVAIATPTTGLTHIDVGYCTRRGIEIFSLANCREAIEEVTSTSELTIGLIISLLRKIPDAHVDVTVEGSWNRDHFRSRQLSRLALGIIGLGRIGGHMAKYAHAFGMRVLGYDPYRAASYFSALEVEPCKLEYLLRESDIVSLHANLRNDNINLLGAEEIALLHKDALIINTARGALLDEQAIAIALRAGRIGGVAVDVLADEHSSTSIYDSPLISAAKDGFNVIVTPHIGGCTSDAMHITEERIAEVVVQILGDNH